MKEVCIRINSQGIQVKDAGGKWVPGDPKVVSNVIQMLKDGLPNKPELEKEG